MRHRAVGKGLVALMTMLLGVVRPGVANDFGGV